MKELFKLVNVSVTAYFSIKKSEFAPDHILFQKITFEQCMNPDIFSDKSSFEQYLDDLRHSVAKMNGTTVSNVSIIPKELYDLYTDIHDDEKGYDEDDEA
ncbi:MAG: hypothetical protein ACI4J1_04615 [Ruminiclostridium sp.]